MSQMNVLEIRRIFSRLLLDWERLACNCDHPEKHARDCTVKIAEKRVNDISRALARLDEIAQKGL